ncbi:MAG: FAD-binding protein [Deltaproteobacteria bacterium]|nr:FAD-binding protein [Deltaproteobacteria bacterium]
MVEEKIAKELRAIAGGDGYLDSREDLLNYSYDSSVDEAMPDAVVLPNSTEQISKIMKIADREKIPVIARGAGTNLSGGSIAVKGGIVIALTRMNAIKEFSKENRYAIVEAGLVNLDFQNYAMKQGLFFPPDPSSWAVATIGGNIAENAGGPRGVKYGVTRDWILGLKAVLADGTVIQTGGVTFKNVTGVDLTSLFCGSEGLLGIVTEATLKLLPLPPFKQSLQVFYPKIDDASKTVARIIGSGIVPVALELMDRVVINVVEDAKKIGLPKDVAAMLLVMVDGIESECRNQVRLIEQICKEEGASRVAIAENETQEEALWLGRRSALGCMSQLRPNCLLEDVTVPVSNLPVMIKGIYEIATKYNLTIGVMAHAGDGNTHPMIVTDKRDKEEWERAEKAIGDIFKLAVDLGGTLSGEHGVGISKKPFMNLIYGEAEFRVLKDLKKVLDPNGILNPGKIM